MSCRAGETLTTAGTSTGVFAGLRAWSLVFAALFGIAGSAAAEPAVIVEGQVLRPGVHPIASGARLLQAAQAAGVTPDAYLTGAAWLSRSRIDAQRALKAGVLFDLRSLQQGARVEGNEALAALAERLIERVRPLTVTGRRAGTLDPVRLETDARSNHLIAAGDRLLYPPRPTTIRVTGAVANDCALPFSGLRPAADYLADCPLHAAADTDWLYLIQPDGKVSRRGLAAWNREPAQPLAPGATLYVPLRAGWLTGRAEGLNEDFAAFLATQPLPLAEGAQ